MGDKRKHKVPAITEEQRIENQYQSIKSDPSFLPPPTQEKCDRLLSGEPFALGGLVNPEILEIRDSMYALIESEHHAYGNYVDQQRSWFRVNSCRLLADALPTTLYNPVKWELNCKSTSMDSLIHHIECNGIDTAPSYQRNHVWDEGHRTNLLDTIFRGGDIGQLVLYHRMYDNPSPVRYEVIDGKQRISTVYYFITDQFRYRGFLCSQLSHKDRIAFDRARFNVAEVDSNRFGRELTENEKIEIFLQVNTTGIPQSDDFINQLKLRLLNE